MYIVGTAGHVDHGKSTLVKALTGIDPDRWAEEKRREMTIDLGFAWLTLPSGKLVSVIDVPGHERFIKNMLAGVGGIDAALLVVAADEAVMPQTEEHLAILDLLGVEHGLVVLTKADLVDAEWLALVQEELAVRLRGTALAAAPALPVSARTGQGLTELRQALDDLLQTTGSRADERGLPRLSIDRAFTIGGFGTVVTGTLVDGQLAVGQEVEILPQRLRARIRGLQSHNQRQEVAWPGTRTAVNLTGVHHEAIRRGDLLTLPAALEPTSLIDVQLRTVAGVDWPLEHNAALDLFVGAAEVRCRAALLDRETLAPGATGWVQLRLESPIAVERGDRYIVRRPSPSLTIGGGKVVDAHPARHRRFRPEVVTRLTTLARGTPAELLLQALDDELPHTWAELCQTSALDASAAAAARDELLAGGRLVELGNDVYITPGGRERLAGRLQAALQSYHTRFPLRSGMPREELRRRLKLAAGVFNTVLEDAVRRELIVTGETSVGLRSFTPTPSAEQRRAVEALLKAMARSPYNPPQPELDSELLAWMLEHGLLTRVSADVFFLPATYAELVAWVQQTLTAQPGLSVGQFRDHFNTSRKFALAFLEHLDEQKMTRRNGNERVLYAMAGQQSTQ